MRRRAVRAALAVVAAAAGAAAWLALGGPPATPRPTPRAAPGVVAGVEVVASTVREEPAARPLASRSFVIPVEGVKASALAPGFDLARGGDARHEALDIMAPAGTPVVAVDDGAVEKLFTSKAGGLTIYQFDREREHAYYYAHLDRYVTGLAEGQRVIRGQRLGYVGTTGNAPRDAPHLHFAIFRLGAEKRWWQGTAIDPYPLLRRGQTAGG